MQTNQKLKLIRDQFQSLGITGYLQPVHDEYLSEYPPACFQRVAWLSEFTGSAGTLVILADKAALFVDGRYTLQACSETDNELFSIHNSGDTTPESWLADQAANAVIGYDPSLFTTSMIERMEITLSKHTTRLLEISNPVDSIWKERPELPASQVFLHDDAVAGESSKDKCLRLANDLRKEGLDAAFIAAPDALCWLLNIRASDAECTPLLLARGCLHADGTASLLADPSRLPPLPAHIRIIRDFTSLAGKQVLTDVGQTPISLVQALEKMGASVVKGTDPCLLPKACKNAVQLACIRAAHLRDGKAVTKLLHWLETHNDINSVTEIYVADKLLAFRKEHRDFVEPSFPTIAGSGPNGAIVHYRATEKTNRHLHKGELLLLDSGGQYPDGTTDVTRTVAIGDPTPEQKDRFTRVLKGHIALATAVFPKGTRGSQLDALARQFLWQVGLDYDHGTGHGVGQFLGVHEGPQRIGKRGGDAVLQPGMILSNEPGYYKAGEYGIRIENLVIVIEKENEFLGFETITCVPLDEKLLDDSLLTDAEKAWLSAYQSWAHQGG